jgi:hypothetical protein
LKPSDGILTAKQDAALVALLAHGTIEAAYVSAGVSKATMWRFLQLPAFQARYKAARRELVDGALAQLQRDATIAARVLREVAEDRDAPASARVTAAKAILDHSIGAIELGEMVERVERLEAMLNEQGKGKGKKWA